jgi:hypothetical protein
VNGTPPVNFAGLAAVRITWITALAVCVLAILSGLHSATDGGNSSRLLPGFDFAEGGDAGQLLPDLPLPDPASAVGGAETQSKAQKAKTAAPQGDASQRAVGQAPGESHSKAHQPNRSGGHPNGTAGQPENAAGRGPAGTSRPNAPQAPSVTQPDLPQLPRVTLPNPPQVLSNPQSPPQSPPQEPSGNPGPQPPADVSVSAQVPTPGGGLNVSASVELP